MTERVGRTAKLSGYATLTWSPLSQGQALRAATEIERAFRAVWSICLQIYYKTLHFVQNITNVTFCTW